MTIVRHAYLRLAPEHREGPPYDAVVVASQALADLPMVRRMQVLQPADPHARSAWDLCLEVEFDSLEDFEAYRVDAEHRRYVDEFLKPRLEVIKAWNFTRAGTAPTAGA